MRSRTPALGGKPLFASAIKLVAHQNWGNKSLCASVRQRLNKAMQPGDPAERVRVPAPGCRGPAQRGGLENRTRRGKGRRTERVPRSRQVPGVQPVCRFLVGTHGRSRSAQVRRTETAPRMGSPLQDLRQLPEPTPRARSESRWGPTGGRSHQLPIVCSRDRGALT